MCMNYNETSQWAADLGSGYSSIRPLGEGGMGTLYRAHKDSLDVDVVIKRVKQKFKGRMDERAEANILKTLKHKYLPRIYDVIESPSGYVYTIMDMIPGENMQNYVKTHGPVSQKLAYRWACQLCEVIAYLHSQVPPILHCDIKPSNIMITPNEDICVIDFNTSLVFSKGVLAIGATPGYAAPEQYTRPGASPDTIETVPLEETMPLRGYKDAFAYQNIRSNKDPSGRGVSNSVTAAQATNAGGYGTISKRTDVYGIGATLYYAITGQQPGHSLKDVRPITSYKLKFSRSFLLIIARAMMKRQEERFCDAQEMLRALQDIHAIDGRYKKVVHSQRVVAAVSLVLAVSGTLAILFGVQRIGVERYAAYDALVRKGRTAADEMRFDEAEQDLQQAIAIYDDQLEAYVEQAVLLYRQGKYQECIDAVETTQSRELKYYSRQSVANLYNVAAEAYYELESYESAATMYQKAIGYSPDILSYYQGEATALIQLGDYSGADEVLAEMAKAVPDAEQSGAYQVVQSELLRKQGDLPDALDAARKAIGSADGNDQLARAYRLAASICEDIGDSMLSEEINLLNNISVVDILDFFEENGTAYFAMELIEGCNLRVFRKNHNPKQTLKMALQMLFLLGSSLAEVHRFGMIHGDISPENILITQDGEIKLIDFGAARSFRQGSDNKERKIYLKPNYAPYEQYTQKPCQGPWTDIYALAATFYFIVSGRKMLDALSRAKGASYPPLHELCPAVSRQLSDVIDKALAFDYHDRYRRIEMVR